MIHDGNQNEFCYAQALLYYRGCVGNLYFEQDGAPSNTSKANIALINELFGEKIIQNPPNCPDLAYPIEDLWAILKNRVKRRNPKNLEELKKFMFEEWYSVPQSLTKKLTDNYLKRVKLIKQLGGASLETEHLKKIKHKEGEYGDEHKWEKRDFQILTIYNDEQLLKHKNREIALMRKVLRSIPSKFKKNR